METLPEFLLPFVDDATREILQTYSFDAALLEEHQRGLKAGRLGPNQSEIKGSLTPPRTEDLLHFPEPASGAWASYAELGNEAIERGQLGALILAGGMATRFDHQIKALCNATDGKTFLEIKLRDAERCARDHEQASLPVYIMTSFATESAIAESLAQRSHDRIETSSFPQFVSLRLREDGELFLNRDRKASPYAPGHGDLPEAFATSGLLEDFLARGGKYLWMSNVDNLGATLDAAILGAHIAAGLPMTAELVQKKSGDQGGAPAWYNEQLQIIEGFRFPRDFDQDSIPVFNTNTFLFNAEALARDAELDYFCVRKQVDDQPALQFERLIGQITAQVDATYLVVPRDGAASRFLPIKTPADLERERASLHALLQARGVL